MTYEMTSDGPNVLAPDTLARLRQAFSDGPVFGRHYHYKGGRSGDNWAFYTFEQFWEYVSSSRPGDLYHAWSLPDLLERGVALLHASGEESSSTSAAIESGLSRVKAYLDTRFNEYLALFLPPDQKAIEVHLDDDSGLDDLRDLIEEYRPLGSEIVVFPFTEIDAPDYRLIDAKYPNAEGKVPLGGAY